MRVKHRVPAGGEPPTGLFRPDRCLLEVASSRWHPKHLALPLEPAVELSLDNVSDGSVAGTPPACNPTSTRTSVTAGMVIRLGSSVRGHAASRNDLGSCTRSCAAARAWRRSASRRRCRSAPARAWTASFRSWRTLPALYHCPALGQPVVALKVVRPVEHREATEGLHLKRFACKCLFLLVGCPGIEPGTSGLKVRCSTD